MDAPCGSGEEVVIDFNTQTNPTLRVTWLDASGAEYNGIDNAGLFFGRVTLENTVGPQLTSADGAPFPDGELRLGSIGQSDGQVFDMLITVPETFTFYSNLIDMRYEAPFTASGTQASVTPGGFTCLGLALQTSTCDGAGTPDFYTATCPSGQATYLHGASTATHDPTCWSRLTWLACPLPCRPDSQTPPCTR